MFVHRGNTGEGVIITMPAGKVSASLCAADCRFKSARYICIYVPFFFAGNFFSVLSLLQCTHDHESAVWVPLLGLSGVLGRKQFGNLIHGHVHPEHAMLNPALSRDSRALN